MNRVMQLQLFQQYVFDIYGDVAQVQVQLDFVFVRRGPAGQIKSFDQDGNIYNSVSIVYNSENGTYSLT